LIWCLDNSKKLRGIEAFLFCFHIRNNNRDGKDGIKDGIKDCIKDGINGGLNEAEMNIVELMAANPAFTFSITLFSSESRCFKCS